MTNPLTWLGALVLGWLRSLGAATFFFRDLLRHSPVALRRFGTEIWSQDLSRFAILQRTIVGCEALL